MNTSKAYLVVDIGNRSTSVMFSMVDGPMAAASEAIADVVKAANARIADLESALGRETEKYSNMRAAEHALSSAYVRLREILGTIDGYHNPGEIWAATEAAALQLSGYRQRATQAEQAAAELRAQLKQKPDYKWFVELVRRHLGQSEEVRPQQLAHQVKQLKEARGSMGMRMDITDSSLAVHQTGVGVRIRVGKLNGFNSHTHVPPVGTVCEFYRHQPQGGEAWVKGTIRYVSEHTVVIELFEMGDDGMREFIAHPRTVKFRDQKDPRTAFSRPYASGGYVGDGPSGTETKYPDHYTRKAGAAITGGFIKQAIREELRPGGVLWRAIKNTR